MMDKVSSEVLILRNVEGRVRYLASQKLKEEVEKAGLTGIEFQPVVVPSADWLQGGHRKKVYGKA